MWTNKYYVFKINLIVFQLVTYFFSCKRLQYLQLSKTFYNICKPQTNEGYLKN